MNVNAGMRLLNEGVNLTFIVTDEQEKLTQETPGNGKYVDDEPIKPKELGLCGNVVDVRFFQGAMLFITCNRPVDDQDIEAVELPPRGKRRDFVCGPCAERLLTLKPTVPDMDKPPKMGKLSRHRPGPRLHKGEDLRR